MSRPDARTLAALDASAAPLLARLDDVRDGFAALRREFDRAARATSALTAAAEALRSDRGRPVVTHRTPNRAQRRAARGSR